MSNPHLVHDPSSIRTVWEERCASHDDLSPFLTSAFLEGLERVTPWQRVLIAWDNGVAWQTFVRRRGPARDLVLPPFSPFSAILLAPDTPLSALHVLDSPIAGLPSDRLVSLDPYLIDSRPDEQLPLTVPKGFSAEQKATYVLESAPLESALTDWSSSARRTYRKHHDRFEFVAPGQQLPGQSDETLIDRIVELVASGYERHGRALPLPSEPLAGWAASLVDQGVGSIVGLRDRESEEWVAGIVLLHNRSRAWYWLAGSMPGPAMTVLLGHTLDHLHHQGIPGFDLMGANTPGISEFKRRFGGTLVEYPHWQARGLLGQSLEWTARLWHRNRDHGESREDT